MSYMYGLRGTCKPSPLTEALRQELYPMPYDTIDWNKARWEGGEEELHTIGTWH